MPELSRRNFLKGAGVAAVGAAVVGATSGMAAPVFGAPSPPKGMAVGATAILPQDIDISQLKTELLTDPQGLGYGNFMRSAGTSSNSLASLMNAPDASIQIYKGKLPSSELLAAMTQAEFDALTDKKIAQLQILMSAGDINMSDVRTRGQVGSIFGNGSTSLSNFISESRRDGSRAEQLFGKNVSRVEISLALAS